MADIDIPAVLDRAADHIDRVGWHQGDLYNPIDWDEMAALDCRVCAIGAINVALHGTPLFSDVQGEAEANDIATKVEDFLGLGEELLGWNDEPGRTQAEVTGALRDTAAALRAEADRD